MLIPFILFEFEIHIKLDALKVISACFCCTSYFYTDITDYLSCNGHSVCCCLERKMRCGISKQSLGIGCTSDEDQCCELSCFCCAEALRYPSGCCQSRGQMCCCAAEGNFPNTGDSPSACAVFGFMCTPIIGCCVPYSEVDPLSKGLGPSI
jgi:hypothetical protein